MSGVRRTVAFIFAIATLGMASVPLFYSEDVGIATHHLLHGALIAGGVITGIILAQGRPTGKSVWIFGIVGAPLLIMFLMWPSLYALIDTAPAAHAGEHLAIAVFAFTCAYSGERYAKGVGALIGILTVGMAVLASGGFGVVH